MVVIGTDGRQNLAVQHNTTAEWEYTHHSPKEVKQNAEKENPVSTRRPTFSRLTPQQK
jgi:hypothetical protein